MDVSKETETTVWTKEMMEAPMSLEEFFIGAGDKAAED